MNTKEVNSVKLSRDKKTLVIKIGNQTFFVNPNLVRFALGVEYTRKNGALVTVQEIKAMKAQNQKKYVEAVNKAQGA